MQCALDELILRSAGRKKNKEGLILEGINMLSTVLIGFLAILELLVAFAFCNGT